MPVAIDEATFSFMARTWDYDLGGSLVATDDGVDTGLCILAVRADEAWIGGVGVVAGRRGEGIGERLMRAVHEEARQRAVRRLWLEVLVQNTPAVRLYEKLGYRHVRELEVWSLDRKLVSQAHDVASVAVADAVGRSPDRLPWQRADASVMKIADARAVAGDRGSLVYRTAGGVVSLLQLVATDDQAIHELLGSLPDGTAGLRYLNGPAGDPVNAVLQSLGGTQVARQHEMLLEL
jgi:predicted N-acetyltransferase YhbS